MLLNCKHCHKIVNEKRLHLNVCLLSQMIFKIMLMTPVRKSPRCHVNTPLLCSHCEWLLIKGSTIGIGFNRAKTNCEIAHILGILLINSNDK